MYVKMFFQKNNVASNDTMDHWLIQLLSKHHKNIKVDFSKSDTVLETSKLKFNMQYIFDRNDCYNVVLSTLIAS